MDKAIYWLSDIYFEQESTKVKIIDLETGNDFTMDVHEHDKLTALFNNFKNSEDIEAIKILQC